MQNTCNEIWKPVLGYEGKYEVSTLGRVKSLPKSWRNWNGAIANHSEKILKPRINSYGYERVSLRDGKSTKELFIHRLVAQAFIPNPNKYPEINHKDENPLNNHVDNLEWCTHIYNNQYGSKNRRGALNRGVSVSQYDLHGNYICTYPTIRDAERATGIYINLIRDCANGVTKQGGGFVWKYKMEEKNIIIIENGKNKSITPAEKEYVTRNAYSFHNNPDYITRKEAYTLLKIQSQAFDSYVAKIGYTTYKFGKFRYYKKSDIEELGLALKGLPPNRSKRKMDAIKRLVDKHSIMLSDN